MDLAQPLREHHDAGLLRLRTGVVVEQLAQALTNGARGVNQRLPPVAPEAFANSYKDMCRFVLFGAAEIPELGDLQRRRASAKRAARAHH